MAEGIILNSFNDLEPGAIKALQDKESGNYKPTIYPVGPVVLMDTSNKVDDEPSQCLKWLDEQPRGSVLYISLGSGGTLSHVQLIELAIGLEMSEQRFVWVIRLTLLIFYLMGSWKVGGFWTHCGWNSTLESMIHSVPLIAWPLYAEQRLNAVLLNEGLKVALRTKIGDNGIAGRLEIAEVVKELMVGEEGKEVRKKNERATSCSSNGGE
uniref:Hydroquinone glucosyltransferase-like n=1 Tax=Nicotiana tabacum TaxID=4097 RepID=A0A1S4DDH3_TOBAC|nr:PREDICTED: hydroquinone glucosyltransferase-like [Nicotiana tabacum]